MTEFTEESQIGAPTPEETIATTDFAADLAAGGVRPPTPEEEDSERRQATMRDLAGETGLSFSAIRAIKRLMQTPDGVSMFVALRALYEQTDFTAIGCDAGYPFKRDGQASVVRLLRRVREADIVAIEN